MPISYRGFRPGSPAHALVRKSVLRQRAKTAQAMISGAKTVEERRRAQRRMAAAERELHKIAAREDYRSRLSERDRAEFDHLSLGQQDRLRTMLRDYPDSVPRDLPDPFAVTSRKMILVSSRRRLD